MSLFRILLVLFITVPLLELYILIHVGGLIGIMPTISICILTAVIGAALFRYQGLQTLYKVQSKLSQGELPATELIEGVILLLCGAMLLTPGFFTDGIGFLCLVPPVRRQFAVGLLKQLFTRVSSSGTINQTVTLEGEFWEDENKRLKK